MQDHMQREEQPYINRLIDLTLLTLKDTEKVQILQTQYNIHCGRRVHLCRSRARDWDGFTNMDVSCTRKKAI